MCFLKAAHLSSFFFFSGNIKRKANLYESLKEGEVKKKWLEYGGTENCKKRID
jgi:hypothetical protein